MPRLPKLLLPLLLAAAFTACDQKPSREDQILSQLPLQDAYGGPNYFKLDPNALYEIHIDNNGDAKEDLSFQFRFTTTLANGGAGVTLPIGGKNVASTTWGAGGQLNGTFTPTKSGYYTVDIYHYNQAGGGNYDVNVSINNAPSVSLGSRLALPMVLSISCVAPTRPIPSTAEATKASIKAMPCCWGGKKRVSAVNVG